MRNARSISSKSNTSSQNSGGRVFGRLLLALSLVAALLVALTAPVEASIRSGNDRGNDRGADSIVALPVPDPQPAGSFDLDVVDTGRNDRGNGGPIQSIGGPADSLVGNGTGCYYNCIETGYVAYGDDFDHVVLHISANTDVSFDIAVSTQAPWYINDMPILANEVYQDIDSQTSSSLVTGLHGLDGDTTYHVVAEVTDNQGYVQYAVGQFHTLEEPPPPPAEVSVIFEKMHVISNGDAWPMLGEITFLMGLGTNGSTAYWQTGQLDLADGDSKTLNWGTTVLLEEGQSLPQLLVNAKEYDYKIFGGGNTCGTGQTLFEAPTAPVCANGTLHYSVVEHEVITLDLIESLPDCSGYSLPAYKDNRKCLLLADTGTPNNDYVDFTALISFEING
ncbi:MAG: hypothetical protein AAGA65_19835 [Actinomycetota bacterium]